MAKKVRQIGIVGVKQVGATDSGDACIVRIDTMDGRDLNLVFPASGAPVLANRIMAAFAMAYGREAEPSLHGVTSTDGGLDAMPAARVTEFAVTDSRDATFVKLMLQSGQEAVYFALLQDQSADLRQELEAAETRLADKRRRQRS